MTITSLRQLQQLAATNIPAFQSFIEPLRFSSHTDQRKARALSYVLVTLVVLLALALATTLVLKTAQHGKPGMYSILIALELAAMNWPALCEVPTCNNP